MRRMMLLGIVALICPGGAAAAELETTDRDGLVVLRNRAMEVTFATKKNMAPTGIRLRSGKRQNLMDLLIVSYLTGESKWWYQDDKGGREGYRHFEYDIERSEAELRLAIRHPSDQPDDPHFRYTKAIVLGLERPFVELDYDFTCVRDGELKSDIALPNLWFAEGLSYSALIGRGGTLFIGPQSDLPERGVVGRWYAAYDPETGEGLLVAFVSEVFHPTRCGWSRGFNHVVTMADLRQSGGMKKGARVRSKFALRPFVVEDPAAELPGLAAEVLAHYELEAKQPRRTKVVGSSFQFDFADLALWERYRGLVVHPASTLKQQDIANAKRNMARFPCAKEYVERLAASVGFLLDKDRAYFEHMIPATTPCSTLFTMCPACDAFPVHGRYHWSPNEPDRLVCASCRTVYPNAKYPEEHVYVTKWGAGQKLTAYAGKSWPFYKSHHFTSTFLGNIRRRKVQFMTRSVRKAALAYALTDDVRYAEKVRLILLRLAAVYPNYLVHTGYNEFADLDPKVAAARINDLPEDEVTFAPNKPNRALYPGYWMAGRATGVGMEGVFLTNVAEAYDLTCTAKRDDGTPVYSEDERKKVERDLLIEGTYLLLHDSRINNKTASNRRGVGVVGMVVGDPLRVRFGMEGFRHFVDEWYLFDGSSSESSGYGYMTLNGIFPMGQALHGYSDPAGFALKGKRFDKLDVYGDPRYQAVFRAFYESLLPDLKYPVLADHHAGSGMGTRWAEVMFDQYGDHGFLAILQRRYTGQVAAHWDEYALFHRPADADVRTPVELELRSVFFPAWKVGYLRGGRQGCGPTLVLSASDWGGHHHLDGLSMVYHVAGQECLSDLGYLWDSPDKDRTRRTFAHNLVVADESNQIGHGRLGRLHLFDDSGWVKVIEASSNAYPQCKEYRRTCVMVECGEDAAYVVDCFRVEGGERHDYVFHGPNESLTAEPPGTAEDLKLYDLRDLRRLATGAKLSWSMKGDLLFDAWLVPSDDEVAYIGTGWGQRTHREKPGATLPYIVRRRAAVGGASAFVSVFEARRGSGGVVRGLRPLDCGGDTGVSGVCVQTVKGRDFVISNPSGKDAVARVDGREVSTNARLTVVSVAGQKVEGVYMLGGTEVSFGKTVVCADRECCSGEVVDFVNSGPDSYLVVNSRDLPKGDYGGRWLVLDDGVCTTGYPVEGAERQDDQAKVFTRKGGRGFRIDYADKWRIWHRVSVRR